MSYNTRPDKKGTHRSNYERNKKRILATQNICAICGHPVDMSLKYPHPMSATIDHIIPVAKNGHPSSLENLQLSHFSCNRQKSDKLFKGKEVFETVVLGNRNLPQSMNWVEYKAGD